MKRYVMYVLSLAIALGALAEEKSRMAEVVGPVSRPFGEMIKRESVRAAMASPSLTPSPNVVLEGAEANFIFSVVGSAGAFHTEAVIMNRLNRTQYVDVYYLPLGAGNCSVPGTRLRLDANTWYFYSDFVNDVFHLSGFGSVVAFGVTSLGDSDSSARIDGNARIWSLASGGGTASQNFPSMSIAVPPGNQSAFGLRKDEFYRTNWGILNYDTTTRRFDVIFNGLRGFSSITVDIPPCSLIQQAVPGGPYGSFEIAFSPHDGSGLYYAYGSSVDNASSDAWSVPARK